MIKVLFFAKLREQLGCEGIEMDAREVSTVAELRRQLIELHPRWAASLDDRNLLVAVNQTLAKAEHPVGADDEVAFFPPVTGG
jgi:molybdopterin synthase sulfur carrier subunit